MDLQYYKTFKENTSQGIVGLLRPLNHNNKSQKVLRLGENEFSTSATNYFFVADEPTHPIYVFKIFKDVNTLADHEFKAAKDMEELSSYLPHFNRIFEIKRNIKCYIPNKLSKYSFGLGYNPFSEYNCIRDVLIIEYIPSKLTFLKYVTETNFSGCSDSLIHQLILSLFIAQQEKKFTHYDLHLENILLRRCLKRTFFLYKFLYEGVTFSRLVYTNGYFPVLFDYGFAYSQGSESTSYNNSFFFTNKGYTPFMFDEINDFKTLMVRMSYYKNCPQKFKKIADENFLKSQNLKFDLSLDTGWIKTKISSGARIVCKKLEKSIKKLDFQYADNFVYKNLESVIDLFGILIKLPIGQNTFKLSTLDSVVQVFLTEWKKIDVWFGSPLENNDVSNEATVATHQGARVATRQRRGARSEDFVLPIARKVDGQRNESKLKSSDDKLNILKKIFETINELIEDQENDQGISANAFNHKFKLKLFEIFDEFGDFVNVQNLNYGQFLTSIIEISNFIEHVVYAEIQKHKKIFNFTDFMDNWTLFTSIEDAVVTNKPYKFQEDDSIVMFNCIEKSASSFDLKDGEIIEALNLSSDITSQIDLLNNLHLTNFSEE